MSRTAGFRAVLSPGARSRPTPLTLFALALAAAQAACLRVRALPLWLAAVAGTLAAVSAVLLAAPLSVPSLTLRRTAAVLLLSLGLGAGLGLARLWPQLPVASARGGGVGVDAEAHLGLPRTRVGGFSGVLVRDSAAGPRGSTRYELRLERVWAPGGVPSATAAGRLSLIVAGGPRLVAGRELTAAGTPRRAPRGDYPPLVCTGAADSVRVGEQRSPLGALRERVQEAALRRFAALGPEPAALLAALVLGLREEIPPELYAQFRDSGSLHLLALSGLHVGILYALVLGLLRAVPDRRLRALAAAAAVLAYLLLAGPRPSLLRAVVMILAAAAARLLDRDPRPLNLLALAALVVLLIDPRAVGSLSFQLSFLALAGLILLGPGLRRGAERFLPPVVAAPAAYSLAAQAATMPLLALRFGLVQPVGAAAALPLIPLTAGFIWTALAYLLLAPAAPFLELSLRAALQLLYRALALTVGLFARVPPVAAAGRLLPVIALVPLLLLVWLNRRAAPPVPAP